MTAPPPSISIVLGTEAIDVTVRRDERARARLVVRPSGAVEARVPEGTSKAAVNEFVRARTRWILKQRDYFEQFRPIDPPRRYVSGETVRYLGRQYRLRIRQAEEPSAKLQGRYLVIEVPDVQDTSTVRETCRTWYWSRAKDVVRRRMSQCLASTAVRGIGDSVLRFRWMTRRWGSCSRAGRLTINPLLVIAPANVIDYVVTHELCHTVHANHGRPFYRLLSAIMPDWEVRRARLDRLGRHLTY